MLAVLERGEAERVLDAEKDAGMQPVAWEERRRPSSGLMIRQHLSFVVEVDPAPSVGTLLVDGLWKHEHHIEIFLYAVLESQQNALARLCYTVKHDDLHWHFFEGIKGADAEESVSPPPSTIDVNSMLDEVFVPRLKIKNLERPLL